MRKSNQPGKFIHESSDGFVESNLRIDDLPDLPIGVLVCQPIWSETGHIINVTITYCNAFASSLIGIPRSRKSLLSSYESPYLKRLYKQVCTVMETGTSLTIESYEKDIGGWLESSIARKKDSCLVYIQNNKTEKYKDNLQRRLDLESIISKMSSRVLAISSQGLNAFIHESLAQVGSYNKADRAYIFDYSLDKKEMNCTHEWCAEGIPSQLDVLQKEPTRFFPWWHQKMMNQETIRLISLDDLPNDAVNERESLEEQGVKSLLVVPLVFDNNLVGFVGFDAVREPRQWDENDADLLKTFSSLVVTATNRVTREQMLERVNKRLTGLNRISHALLTSRLREEHPDLTALKHIYDMIPCEVGIVFRIDSTGQVARTESLMRRGRLEKWSEVSLAVKYLSHTVLSRGKEMLINRLKANTRGFPDDFNPYAWGHRSMLAVPLFANQQYVGLLVLLDKVPDFFTKEHVLIAREVAGQLSILLVQEEASQQLATQARELNESNQLLQAIIDTSPTGLALLEPVYKDNEIVDFRYKLNNPTSATITGLERNAMPGQPLLTLFPHLYQNGLFRKMVSVALTGVSEHVQILDELPYRKFWGDFSLVRVGDNILFTVNDITPLKLVEEQLRQTNSELEKRVAERTSEIQQLSALQRAILKYAGLAIAATNTDGIIQLVNPALEAITGYRADELVGQHTPGVLRDPAFHLPQIDELVPALGESTAVGEGIITTYIKKHNFLRRENMLLTKEGRQIPVISTVSGLYDEQEKLIGFVDIAMDISYLKTIEQELKQANQRSQFATKAGKLGVWEWNLLTNELILDENFFRLFGLPVDTPIYRIDDLAQIVHPDDLAYFNAHVAEIIEGQKPFDVEFRVILPTTKTIHYIKADGLILQDESGQNSQIVGVVRNRTAKRQSEHALRESEKRYRFLVDHLKEVVFQTDSNGLWIYLNPAWEQITGFSINGSLGKYFLDFIVPEDRSDMLKLFGKITPTQKMQINHVVRYSHKEGGYRWIDMFAQVMLNDYNEVTGITGTLTDITERKNAEEAIIESEQRFRDIAENVDEIFWIRDLNEPRFIYMNSAYEKFTGQVASDLYKNPLLFLNFVVEKDRAKVMDFFVHSRNNTAFEFSAWHQDGTLRHMSVQVFTVRDELGELKRRIGVATDITAAIEKEQILEESLSRERMLNTLKSQFISTASHEFRTPLAAINSSVELVKHYVNMNTAATTALINQHIDKIGKKIFLLNDLISDTLTISKIDEGKIDVAIEPASLTDLCEETVKFYFSDREDRRMVEMAVIGQAVAVNVDRKLMEHILMNLLSNAFKFSTKNPALTIRFGQNEATVTITDKGIGIPEKDIPGLFSKFFRASNATSFQGTGLGLAICQEYILLQKGRIDIESTVGVGTSFRVTLPFAETT
ncbi:sensor histidine kinase [Spirosoma aerophilum]